MKEPRGYAAAHLVLICLTVVCGVLYAVDVTGPMRLVVTLATMALLPGVAVLTRLAPSDPAVWLGLAIAISLAVETAVSLVMAWSGQWYPAHVAGGLAAVCVLVLLDDVRRAVTPAHRPAP